MKSLRWRLVLLTTTAVAVVWLVTAVLTWRAARHELTELLWDHPVAEQQEIAEEIAEHLLKPMLVALPLLGLLLAVAVGAALRPLRDVTNAVAERAPDRLEPIATADAPREVAPLITRLNSLFAEIERVLGNERRFTADAAHELRTPLAALKAQAQVARDARDAAERDHALAQILVGCDRATHLVEQLLTLARLDAAPATTLERVDLAALAAEVLADAAGQALARDTVLALDAPHPAPLAAPPALLRLLLRNLIDNAIRHTPAGSTVDVAVAAVDGRLRLTVADDGPGIPAGERDKVTQRFYRLGESGTGSGLGLAIVAQVAHALGATLSIGAKVGAGGTAICVEFPAR